MRVLSWLALFVGVSGCAAEPALDPVEGAVLGRLEPTSEGGEWLGVELVEWFSAGELPDCGWQRQLVAEAVQPVACPDCALELKVTETMSPASDGVCQVSDGGMLRAGERIAFQGTEGEAGTLVIDRGDGPEALGTGLFDGTSLSWRRPRGDS